VDAEGYRLIYTLRDSEAVSSQLSLSPANPLSHSLHTLPQNPALKHLPGKQGMNLTAQCGFAQGMHQDREGRSSK
jgi:hypothetical protein